MVQLPSGVFIDCHLSHYASCFCLVKCFLFGIYFSVVKANSFWMCCFPMCEIFTSSSIYCLISEIQICLLLILQLNSCLTFFDVVMGRSYALSITLSSSISNQITVTILRHVSRKGYAHELWMVRIIYDNQFYSNLCVPCLLLKILSTYNFMHSNFDIDLFYVGF